MKRYLGNDKVGHLDPFLLFDEAKFKKPAGFPFNSPRGIHIVSIVKSGRIFHEDNRGNAVELGPGDMQWMTAGKGIIHSEMPASTEEHSHIF